MLRTILLGMVAILLLSIGQTLLKLGLNQIGGVSLSGGVQAAGKLLQTPWVILGLLFYMASTILWLDVLSKLDFSLAFPMMGLNYVFVLLIGYFVFHEPVGLARIMGVALILAGILVLVKSPINGQLKASICAESRVCNMNLSIVIPVYYNEGLLDATLHGIIHEVLLQHPELDAEVIFVDDGSGDGSLTELIALQQRYPDLVKVIKLTRNFGQVNALMAGFSHARGQCVVAMSADGQDPVDLINQMLTAYLDEGYHIVICTREGRDESLYRVLTSRLFYWIMRKLSFSDMPSGGFDFVLLSRQALDVLLRNQEAHPFFQGQLLWMGYRRKFIGYRRLERKLGQSRWTFAKKLTYLMDGVLSYSFLPMRLMSTAGIMAAFLGFLYALVIFILRIVWGNPIQGWAPLMIIVLVIGGLQMLMLGVIGEYLWRALAQVRHREPFIIEMIYESKHNSAHSSSQA